MDKLVVREINPNVFAELSAIDVYGAPSTILVDSNGEVTAYPWSIVDLWGANELAAIGIYLVDPATIPAGKTPTGYGFERVAGVVTQVLTLVDVQIVSVTPLQARRAIRELGLKTQIDAAIAAAGDEAQETWDYALEIRRDDPLLNQIAAGLGLSSSDLDDVFALAATL